MKIIIETIPHTEQRYPTAGDWFYKTEFNLTSKGSTGEEVLYIKVSALSDWRREALIAVHELVEVLLCQQAGVTQKVVDDFDKAFEADRVEGNEEEPGDDPNAPYAKQHCLATAVERMLAAELNVSWKRYEEELSALP